ncbi:NAD(P)/FAD-dependent oxidoreductase [Falsiroseomonas oryziterrae]|uniref:NAD(P)/FAD-dependent oxidoreductase n=1 Tax=Falsiroseomonas oryziterrae TaxID=2911368 RepID=UPI001F24E09D|nr:FAD-binding oxidoreductase [Roseomonas sp. NPKOSM-4]
MPLHVDPVRPDEALPGRADVVVIGGGVVGVSTALFLAERGVSVALCEKGRIAGEQSGRNWGWVRVMGRDPKEIALAIESKRIWQGMRQMTGAETGYREAGIAYLCDTEAQVAEHEAWIARARPYGVESRMLSQAEIAERFPGSARSWAGAIFTAGDARAEPAHAVPAMAEAARRRGAAILTGCAVRGLETTGGRVSAVVTEKGRIDCDAAVLAAGAWSRLFCGNLGIDLPSLKVLGSVMRTKPLEGAPEHAAGASDFAFRKRLDGGYTIAHRGATVAEIVPDTFRLMGDFLPALKAQWSNLRLHVGARFLEEWRLRRRWRLDEVSPFEEVRVLDPAPMDKVLDEGRENLMRAFPAFARMEIAERWAGLIDTTPDAVPVMGEAPALPGLFLACGFSGHGFGIGPGAGKLMADLITGAPPVVDPAPYRPARFARLAAPLRAH